MEDVDDVVKTASQEYDCTIVSEPKTLTRKPIRLAAITDPAGYTVHLIEEQ